MADSITKTVTAIICVIIGILIIGGALVPIVEQASKTDGGTEMSYNTPMVGDEYGGFYAKKDSGQLRIAVLSDAIEINGVPIEGYMSISLTNAYGQPIGNILHLDNGAVYINGAQLKNATVMFAASTIDIAGETIEGEEYTLKMDATQTDDPYSFSGIYSDLFDDIIHFADILSVYTFLASPATFVEGQNIAYQTGDGVGIITIDTQQVDNPYIHVENAGDRVTVTADSGVILIGPCAWSVDTEEGPSQYAALYAIIPVLCIIAMAYVLIREF